MPNPIESLLATGTKLWLDSIDPDLVRSNRAPGATGATSNPIIVADLLATGRFDADIERLVRQGLDDSQIAWQMTDKLVRDAQQVFLPVWEETGGERRLRQFRGRSAAGRPGVERAAPQAGRASTCGWGGSGRRATGTG